ncbi:MAG: hypothetical protein GQ582_06105 [Methyloprofundus sp.]|nr:hypothetical protein [Methyloprofundus sp.]
MKTINRTKFAIGASIIAGLSTACTTDSTSFTQKDLASGYMNEVESGAKKTKEAACGEGKCGASHATTEAAKTLEAKCGEGKCGEK